MARPWSIERHITHVRKTHPCLAPDCRSLIEPGEPAEAVCGREDAFGFWYGYMHPYCRVAAAYEEAMDSRTEGYLTGGDMSGRAGTWESILDRLVGRGNEKADCVRLFEARYAHDAAYQAAVQTELRGKGLMCWCAPGSPCHADVLFAWANAPARRSAL